MFCRISADRTQGGEMRYYPFRLTPYQLTIRDSDIAEPQPCCLLIAERVHSGYEGFHHFLPACCMTKWRLGRFRRKTIITQICQGPHKHP